MDFKNKSFKTSFIVGFVFCSVAIIFLLVGLSDLGMGLFFFLPLAIGISSGLLPNLKQAIWGTLASLGLFSIFLIVTNIEGFICVLLALPILLISALIGWFIGRLFRKKNKDETNLKVTVLPFLIFIAASFLELFTGNPFVKNEVSTTFKIKGTPEQVYNSIIQVDTVDVETNLLQKAGLPIPRKCILTEEKVGGLRLCEFEEGRIVETITEIKKNELLRMDVTESKLGRERHWLKFHEDIYNINPINDELTQITRTTSYSSNLKPRIYWEIMESLTIRIEQDFVFRNLVKDVRNLQ
ncbi:polyketide cyclase [Marinigracilibium pacificum]|uniref:Polyketide cyclase n=1 Tax=Marinigracilibium pacificum TaxID=2729599 RepID=A0A848IXW4_9BACT|nr:polyketide cyclase [Marinigracilibium pacificum]NMM48125.1 polyketide cyclase [Marinigracilibium pacificum]